MVNINAPKNPDELMEDLGNSKVIAKLNSKEALAEYMNSYAENFHKNDSDVAQQVAEGLQSGLMNMMRENGFAPSNTSKTPPMTTSNFRSVAEGKGAAYNKNAPGAKLDSVDPELRFNSTAELFQASWGKRNTLPNRDALNRKFENAIEIKNSFGSEVGSDGGLLIPEYWRSEILRVALEDSQIRSRATVIPMSSPRLHVPAIDDTTHSGSVYGGFTTYWQEEGVTLTETSSKFQEVMLDAKKLTAYATVPNELLADGIAMSTYFDQIAPMAIAFEEDYAFLNGNGVGQPAGIVNNPATVTVNKDSGQAAATISWQNIVNMYARLLPAARRGAIWLASVDSFPELATMGLTVGTGGGPVWMGAYGGPNANSGADTPPPTMLGLPLYFTEKLPTLGTTGDICLFNPSFYLIGDRQQITIDQSDQYLFALDKTAFRIIERLDGRPWLQSAITPANGSSNTLSAFVQLQSR